MTWKTKLDDASHGCKGMRVSLINILLVPRERLELSRGQAPRDFKSLASTDSATQAAVPSYNDIEFVVKEYGRNLRACITPWQKQAVL